MPAKHGTASILVRGLFVPVLLTVAGTAFMTFGPMPITPDANGALRPKDVVFLVLGYLLLGQLVIMISAAWLHLRDVLTGSLGITYLAVSNRGAVVLGTAAFAALSGALGALACVSAALMCFAIFAGGDPVASLGVPALRQMMIGLPLGAALLSVIAVAVAVLVRRPVLAIIILVGWATYGEEGLAHIPGVGGLFKFFGPLSNVQILSGAVEGQGLFSSPLAAGLWVTFTATVLLVVAVVVENRRPGWVS
ncbi:hypothetical protein AUCHE_09_00970 [Austwickia chelonae NBRC 105200]|uniref:ABC transporter permease protein n=1 Tax=Austwickia chelonae NBRC 105200 TaxID=1184607 RepID=K6W9K4_9MICO|nr:hypothetical protein AUCHE_09_00970 [Austwickia chelonae NBRC 105200]